jgi:hypothetical protein
MSKFVKLLTAAIFVSASFFSSVLAGPTIGVTATAGVFFAEGTEHEGNATTGMDHNSDSAIGMFVMPSIFIETPQVTPLGLSLGVEYSPATADTDATERTDITGEAGGAGEDQGENKVQVDFKDLTTFYLKASLGETGMYLKYGITSVDAITNEVLASGSTYGDASFDGTVIGFGYRHETDRGIFIGLDADYTEFDEIKMTSDTNTDNSIEANLSGLGFGLSVGKSF